MGLFRSKPKPPLTEASHSEALDIQKIPDVFYGGNNPVIYETTVSQKTVNASTDQKTMNSPRPSQLPPEKSSVPVGKFLWPTIIVGVVVVGGASAYFIMDYLSAKQNVQTPTQVSVTTTTSSNIMSTTTVPIVVSTSTTSTIPTTTPSLVSNFLEFPPINLGSTADIDLDQVTDIEEVLYTIDSGGWDTDNDGYYDGQEITNLYNPRGLAPVKLIDSGLVREYINSFSGYRLYYPITWQQGAVDPESKHVLFSSMTGEYVEVRVFQKNSSSTFTDWFQANAEGEQFSALTRFTNRFGTEGYRRSDNLVVYFDTDAYIFVLLYRQPDPRGPVPFRATFEMMYQSFRPTANSAVLPPQIPLEIPTDPVSRTSTSST